MAGGVLALQIIRHVNTLDLVRLITVNRKPDDEMHKVGMLLQKERYVKAAPPRRLGRQCMCNSRAHCPTNPHSVEKNIFYLHSKYDNVGKDEVV